jgi:hypothetical protein
MLLESFIGIFSISFISNSLKLFLLLSSVRLWISSLFNLSSSFSSPNLTNDLLFDESTSREALLYN